MSSSFGVRSSAARTTQTELGIYGTQSCGFEAFSTRREIRVIAAVELTLPQGPGWHQALRQQMAVEKSGTRRAVISQSSREALEEYRAFRHIVRNIYPFRLDVTRIQPLVEEAPNVFFQVCSDLLEFATFLSGADAPE